MEEIILTLSGDGKIEVETKGFTGTACDKTVGNILVGLNGKVTDDRKKPEYWDEDPVKVFTNIN